MREPEIKRCSRCLLPETYPGITFNGSGVCNHCRSFKKSPPLGEFALKEILENNKGQKYDCLVGISGGKDSCYVAYLAKKKFNLRVLAVCYDFPFLVDLARENVRSVCDKLGIDLEIIKTKNNLEHNLLKNHMKSLAATGTTWGQCIFCHYGIDGVLYNAAKKQRIPLVLGGVVKYELWNPGSRMKFLGKRVRELSIMEKLGFLRNQGMAYLGLVDQRRQFRLPGNNCLKAYSKPKWPEDGPRMLNIYDYIQWEQKEIEETLIRETGWRKPEKAISWRYDCILEPLLDYTYKKEFGISTAGIYLSNLIRDGLITRSEALEKLAQSEDQALLDAKLKDVCRFLDLPEEIERKFSRSLLS